MRGKLAGVAAALTLLAPGSAMAGGQLPSEGSAAAGVPPAVLTATGLGSFGQLGFGDVASRTTLTSVPGQDRVIAVAAGDAHTLMLQNGGTVRAAGRGNFGQLGDGTTADHWSPTLVPGLASVAAISAGANHSLALMRDGTVRAWGDNVMAQLGDGTTTNRLSPVVVPGLTGVAAISAGDRHSLALMSDGTVRAWGTNSSGQLGDGTTTDRLSPVVVPGLAGVAAIAAGGDYSLALLTDGTVVGWGNGGFGQLGLGTTTNRLSPTVVTSSVAAIAAGDAHSLAVRLDGTVLAWGYNANGQVGDGTTTNRLSPVGVAGLSGIAAVTAGGRHSVAIAKDGTVRGWGFNGNGEFGGVTSSNTLTPVDVPVPGGHAAATAAGYDDTFVLVGQPLLTPDSTGADLGLQRVGATGPDRTFTMTSAGEPVSVRRASIVGGGFKLTGDDCTGRVLAPMTTCTVTVAPAPEQVGPQRAKVTVDSVNGPVVSIPLFAQGMAPPGAIDSGVAPGGLLGAGLGTSGQLGDGAAAVRTTFTRPVGGPARVVGGAAGSGFSLALAADGTVWSTGDGSSGQLGVGSTASANRFLAIPQLSDVRAVAAGASHAVALGGDGSVYTWGDGTYGQLGLNSTTNGTTPRRVSGLPAPAIAVAAGNGFTYALLNNGKVYAWGRNSAGQLGDGTTTNRLTPVLVTALPTTVAIAAGTFHGLAVGADGAVRSWGYNPSGQLGDGTTTNRLAPVLVPGLTGVVAVAGGGSHSAALLGDGTIRTWGLNDKGQLGDGTTITRSAPVQPATTGVVSIATTSYDTYVRTADGRLLSWGDNGVGQSGDGSTTQGTAQRQATSVRSGTAAVLGGPAAQHVLAVAQPYVALSTAKLDFAAAAAGSTSESKPVTVTNTGVDELVLGAADIVGSDGDEFTLAGDACSRQVLKAGATCTVNVRYKPTFSHAAAALASLRFPSNAPTKLDAVVLDPPPLETPAPAGDRPVQGAGEPPAAPAPAPTAAPRAGHTALTCALVGRRTLRCSTGTLPAGRATVRLTRAGRLVVQRTLTVRRGTPIRVTATRKRALPKGRYVVTIGAARTTVTVS